MPHGECNRSASVVAENFQVISFYSSHVVVVVLKFVVVVLMKFVVVLVLGFSVFSG